MKTAYDTGINWIWYCDYEIHPNGIEIKNHYRIHKGEGPHPEASLSYRMIEDSNRIVQAISIGSETFPVVNPQHVFSYGRG